jgi:hypothetical protein
MYVRLNKDIQLCHSVIAGKYLRNLTGLHIQETHTTVVPMNLVSSAKGHPEKVMTINEEKEDCTSDFILFI